MATITGLTAERMREIEAASIVDGTIDSNGHLILTKYDGSSIDAGSALVAIPPGGTVQFLNSSYDYTTPSGSYPDGVSLLWIDGSTNATTWPTFAGKWGSIVTINYTSVQSNNDSTQTWTNLGGSGVTPEQWIRTGSSSGWSSWKKLALKDDIDAVNTALDARLDVLEGARTLAVNSIAATADPSVYPSGTSLMDVTNVANTGWPVPYGLVVTQNRNSSRCVQTFYINSVAGGVGKVKHWVRNYHADNPGWSSWSMVGFVESDLLTKSGPLTAGTWYRIATITAAQTGAPAKATADFTIVTAGSGQHSTIRLTAGYAYNDRVGNTLLLQDYSGYSTIGTPFTQARMVPAGSTYDSVHLELKVGTVPSDLLVSVKVDHLETGFPSTLYYLNKWGLVNFVSNGTADIDWGTAGLFWTGRWTGLTLQNGWAQYGTPYPWAEFIMLPGSLIKIRGLVKSGTAATTIATLPVGCRPRYQGIYTTAGGGNTLGRVDVATTGEISHVIGTNTYISLDPVHYKAEW